MPGPTTTLTADDLAAIRGPLAAANAEFMRVHPGECEARQPAHVVYGGAHLFQHTTAGHMGELALASLHTYAPTPALLAEALGWGGRLGELAPTIHERVIEKLRREAVEDLRIDFEDGYGNRPDAEEDAEAARCAEEVAEGMLRRSLPAFVGIRVKTLTEETAGRSLRTLDIFLSTLLAATEGELPTGFVVTLPKVLSAAQVTAFCAAIERIELAHGLAVGTVPIELMIETPQSVLAPEGHAAPPELVAAAGQRCRGVHLGTYDYTALAGITAQHQTMAHPACDFAKNVIQVSLAQRQLMLSDGATNIMPVGPHREAEGASLSTEQLRENREVVWGAWRTMHDHVRHSLVTGWYQGWDLHPAQLPIRYAATYAFFLEGMDQARARLAAFLDKAAQATLLGDVFDDAATGQGLLNVFLRGLACGAITDAEALETGLTLEELRGRSFKAIVEGRTAAS